MPHSFTNLLYHIVFSTKYRETITNGIKERLHRYINGIVSDKRGQPLAIGGVADHVHLFVCCPQTVAVPDLVKSVKGGSSWWVNQQLISQSHFGWQKGYSAFSVSQSLSQRLVTYIEKQEAHHREQTFEDELVLLLTKNNIEFDRDQMFEIRDSRKSHEPERDSTTIPRPAGRTMLDHHFNGGNENEV